MELTTSRARVVVEAAESIASRMGVAVTVAVVAIVLATQTGGTALAQTDTEARNRSIVEASFNAWRDGTGSPYDLLNDDARWTIVGRSAAARTYENREAFIRDVIRPFNARMSVPLRPVVRSIHTDGNTVIVFFDAQGTARDGQPYVNTYAWFLDMRDGRIVEAWAFFDSIAFDELWRRVTP